MSSNEFNTTKTLNRIASDYVILRRLRAVGPSKISQVQDAMAEICPLNPGTVQSRLLDMTKEGLLKWEYHQAKHGFGVNECRHWSVTPEGLELLTRFEEVMDA